MPLTNVEFKDNIIFIQKLFSFHTATHDSKPCRQINYNGYTSNWSNGSAAQEVCDMFFNVLTAENDQIDTFKGKNSTEIITGYLSNFHESSPNHAGKDIEIIKKFC